MRVVDILRVCQTSFAPVAAAAGPGVAALLIALSPASAGTMIWSNGFNAGSATIIASIDEFDANTGALIKSFPDPAATPGNSGLGIAVVGSKIYYSFAGSASVFLTDTSGTNLGAAFTVTVPGAVGIGSIASDGQFLYLALIGATGSSLVNDNVYKYDFSGNLVGPPITLIPSAGLVQGFRSGLEVVGNTFVANQPRGDIGPYDQFNATNGSLITPAFLDPGTFGFTGVAFDGAFYYVFDDEADPSQFVVFNASGSFVKRLTLLGLPGPNDQAMIWDVSAVVAAVPEPPSLVLLVTLLGLFAAICRRRWTAASAA